MYKKYRIIPGTAFCCKWTTVPMQKQKKLPLQFLRKSNFLRALYIMLKHWIKTQWTLLAYLSFIHMCEPYNTLKLFPLQLISILEKPTFPFIYNIVHETPIRKPAEVLSLSSNTQPFYTKKKKKPLTFKQCNNWSSLV